MATLTIRNLDDSLKAALRVQAAQHGHSMEEEVRMILRQALSNPLPERGLGQRLSRRFRDIATDLPIPARSLPRSAPQWMTPHDPA
ncbi:MAG: FitA-like ribbon-helix-helix domain-containing protein [Thiomonas sp.]